LRTLPPELKKGVSALELAKRSSVSSRHDAEAQGVEPPPSSSPRRTSQLTETMTWPKDKSAGAPQRRSLVTLFAGIAIFALALAAVSQWSGGPIRFRSGHDRVDHPGHAFTKARAAPSGDKYLVGVGKGDITGPVVELNFAGYADLAQSGTGLRQRIYSRAFIVGDVANPSDRFVYIVLDTQSGDTAVRRGILEGVAKLGAAYSVYGQGNIAITGTHSHSGPGAWFNYLLPQVTSLGFDQQSYQAIVDGAVLSIKRAHESLTTVGTSPSGVGYTLAVLI
jgi:neutral ceramidase